MALNDGGGIKWIPNEPKILENNYFFNNSAIYGKDIAAFALRIELESVTQGLDVEKVYNKDGMSYYQSILNIGSGIDTNLSMTFAIKDYYNRTVTSLNDLYFI